MTITAWTFLDTFSGRIMLNCHCDVCGLDFREGQSPISEISCPQCRSGWRCFADEKPPLRLEVQWTTLEWFRSGGGGFIINAPFSTMQGIEFSEGGTKVFWRYIGGQRIYPYRRIKV